MTQCRHHISNSTIRGRRCQREAAGEDGLCNVCRAARVRGEKRSQAHYDEQTARMARENALRIARGRVIRAARSYARGGGDEDAPDGELLDAVADLERLESTRPHPIDSNTEGC